MSEVYLGPLEPEAAPLREAVEKLDLEPVHKIIKRASDDLYQHLLDTANDYLASNLSDAIDGAARKLASRYLGEALAGDEGKLKRLFGLWYQSKPSTWSLIDGLHYPDNWELLRVLCERFPDLLRTELLTQREAEIAALREAVSRLKQENAEWRAVSEIGQ